MSRMLGLSDQAREEFVAAVTWYDSQQAGMGDRLFRAVGDTFERIADNPSMYAVVRGRVRMALVDTFPYAIYYRIEADRILIVSVFHASRNPSEWQRRR